MTPVRGFQHAAKRQRTGDGLRSSTQDAAINVKGLLEKKQASRLCARRSIQQQQSQRTQAVYDKSGSSQLLYWTSLIRNAGYRFALQRKIAQAELIDPDFIHPEKLRTICPASQVPSLA